MDDSRDETDAEEIGDDDDDDDHVGTSECAEKGERSDKGDGEEEEEEEDDGWNGRVGGGGDASVDNANADVDDKREGAMLPDCVAGRASVFPSRRGFGGGAVAGGRVDRGGVRKVAE